MLEILYVYSIQVHAVLLVAVLMCVRLTHQSRGRTVLARAKTSSVSALLTDVPPQPSSEVAQRAAPLDGALGALADRHRRLSERARPDAAQPLSRGALQVVDQPVAVGPAEPPPHHGPSYDEAHRAEERAEDEGRRRRRCRMGLGLELQLLCST